MLDGIAKDNAANAAKAIDSDQSFGHTGFGKWMLLYRKKKVRLKRIWKKEGLFATEGIVEIERKVVGGAVTSDIPHRH